VRGDEPPALPESEAGPHPGDPGRHRLHHLRRVLPVARRPGRHGLRQALHPGEPRARPRLHGLRSALVHPVLALPAGRRARARLRPGPRRHRLRGPLPGLLLPPVDAGDRAHRHPAAGDRLARRGRRRPVAGHRRGRRRRLRPQARLAPGPGHYDRHGPGGLRPRLPGGAAGDPPVRLHPRHGAGVRLRPLRRQPPGLGLAPRPALVRAGPHLRRRLRPHGARGDAGEPRRGLRAHRPRRRPARAPGHRPPRHAQHLPAGGHLLRPGPGRASGRGGHHRARLLHAGAGRPAHGRRRHLRRPRRHGGDPRGRRLRHCREPRGGRPGRRHRPPHLGGPGGRYTVAPLPPAIIAAAWAATSNKRAVLL